MHGHPGYLLIHHVPERRTLGYALEDILGGHIAVACISMRNLVDLAENRNQKEVRDLQAIIQKQLDQLIQSNSEYYCHTTQN